MKASTLPTIARTAGGYLPRMTPRQRQAAVRLIRDICSNYNNGNCVLLETDGKVPCPQCQSYTVNCKFFCHVLMEDKDGLSLKSEIFTVSAVKECMECGKTFCSASNNAKYCEDCKRRVLRRQKAAHARKRRTRVEKLSV